MPVTFRGELFDVIQDGPVPLPDAKTLAGLERELGASLPPAYKRFLLEKNGGSFEHETIFTSSRIIKDQRFTVPMSYMFGSERDNLNYHSLTEVNRVTRTFPGFRSSLLVFADSEWQNRFCFETADADRGAIYFWDRDEFRVLRVANDFDDFLTKLTVTPRSRSELFDEMTSEDPEIFRIMETGSLADVDAWLQAGGDVNICNANRVTLLICAANCVWPKIVKHLLDSGADVHAHSHSGTTALARAAIMLSLEEVTLLLAAGANPVWTDSDGRTLLQRLEYVRGTQVWRILKDAGAK